MKFQPFIFLFLFPLVALSQSNKPAQLKSGTPAEKVARDFKTLLRRPGVDFMPSFQSYATDTLLIEKGFIYTEATERVPVLIYKPVKAGITAFPVVICLHGTGGSKEDESIKNLLYQFTKMGMMGVAIDARYHGERIKGGAERAQQYVEAITRAWKNRDKAHQEHPLYYDTVYDLWRLTDYLVTRRDVQKDRIGMMGISMGGIETWMAASVDKRIKVAVPVIAAQSFKWSLQNNSWQGRAGTIRKAHEQVQKDLGDSTVTEENVRLLWAKLLPGITDEFDCPSLIRLFAPRPLLLLNTEKDINCPIGGAELTFEAATSAYKANNARHKLAIHVTLDEPHRFLPEQMYMTIAWFKKWL